MWRRLDIYLDLSRRWLIQLYEHHGLHGGAESDIEVYYSATGTINPTRLTDGDPADVTGPAGLTAVMTIYEMQSFVQGTSTNCVTGVPTHFALNFAQEDYIRGVTEYSGSVLRACLTATNGAFVEGVPTYIVISTEGVLRGQIVSWLELSLDTFYVMIPGTLVAIATIWVVLKTLAHHSGAQEGQPFNPTKAMHIRYGLLSSWRVTKFLHGTGGRYGGVENVQIVLQSIEGRPPGLYVEAGMV
ncbi:hypothetical protein C8R45DRAFT_948145 [Mycena sanguinolenta]|nr:hypothetical protein C8R45DRAFT_948145 [Mycena sanguinolenta]